MNFIKTASLRTASQFTASLRTASLFTVSLRTASLRTASLFTASLFTASLFTASLFTASLLTASLLALPALAFQEKEATWESVFRDPYLEMMDMSNMTTGYFWNMGFPEIETVKKFDLQLSPSGQVYKNPIHVSPQEWKVLYQGIRASDINDRRQLLPLDEIRELEYEYMKSHNIIPVAILNFEGNILSENQIKENVSLKQSGKTNRELYKVLPVTVVSALRTSASQDVTFYLGDNLYFTNRRERVEGLLIDFGDGKGEKFYNLMPNYIPVHYAYGGGKSISFKLIAGRDTVQSFSTIQVAGPEIPVDQEINLQPAGINTGIAGRNPKGGRAHIWLGCDGVFDKPFIMFEGFDVGNIYGPAEFLGETQYGDDFPDSPGEILRLYGYDLVFLNFNDGTDDIKNNAEVAKQLIREVNAIKQGYFENIVIGHSMGGLVARVALAEMEQAGEDHETGLYISFDSPHKGATIPVGLQSLLLQAIDVAEHTNIGLDLYRIFHPILVNTVITYFDGFKWGLIQDIADVLSYDEIPTDIWVEYKDALNSAGARQMLIDHYDFNDHTHEEFVQFLGDLGYPEKLRKISLINGSNSGVAQAVPWVPGEPMLDFGVSIFLPGPFGIPLKTKFQVQGWASTPGQEALVSQVRISQGGVTLSKKHLEYPHGYRFFEPAPGGFMGMEGLQELAEENIPGWLDDFFDVYNGLTITIKDPLLFNFIPIISSLDLAVPDNELFYFNINMDGHKREDLVLNHITAFDDIYAQPDNSIHVARVPDVRNPWNDIFDKEIMVEDLRIQNRRIAKPLDFEARVQIVTGRDVQDTAWHKLMEPGDFVVKENATVTLTAGNSIIFEDGTIVEDGGMLIANVTGDTTQVSCVGSPLSEYPNYYFTIEGPETYCPGQAKDIFSLHNSSMVKGISTSWWLDNEPEKTETSNFMIPQSLSQGGHMIHCEVSLYDELGQLFQRTQVSHAFLVLGDDDPACGQAEQKLISEMPEQLFLNPNPATSLTKIQIKMMEEGEVSLSLLSLDGGIIKELLKEDRLSQGVHEFQLTLNDVKTGVYLISLQTVKRIENKRLVIIK